MTQAMSSGPVGLRLASALQRIAERDADLSALSLLDTAAAWSQAAVLDDLPADRHGPLHGMIISIKDVIDMAGLPTGCASHSRAGHRAEQDAALISRLREAGALLIGKANCHEFAFGGPAFDLPQPPARNPWDPSLFPGGSSSGSGVAVAAGFCDASIGTDTYGSIRLPAAHCGITGFKPGHDVVPLAGVVPLAPSLDTAGPLARSVADCTRILRAIADPGALTPPAPLNETIRLGLPDNDWLAASGCHAEVLAAMETAIARLIVGGVEVRRIALPALARFHAPAAVIMMREAAEYHASAIRERFDAFGEMFRNRALLGERIPARHYAMARRICADLARQMAGLLDGLDAILLPGNQTGPMPLARVDKFYFLGAPNINAIASGTGMPALSLPVMRDASRRPFGIQMITARGGDLQLLALGTRIEAMLGHVPGDPFEDGPEAQDLPATQHGDGA